ncbi:hypothetical protein MAR_012448, partial [Mya arenaria]
PGVRIIRFIANVFTDLDFIYIDCENKSVSATDRLPVFDLIGCTCLTGFLNRFISDFAVTCGCPGRHPPVAFSAVLTHDIASLGTQQQVPFDKVH